MQDSPPGIGSSPDLEISGMGKEGFSNMPEEFYTSSQPWTIRFLKFSKDAFGMDFSAGARPPINELVVD